MNTREKYIEMLESEEHERRMRAIEQNGNTGEHYEQDMLNGFNKPTEELDPSYSCTDSRIVADAILKAEERKAIPVYSGFVSYFPNAMKEVAQCSYKANKQHNGDEPLHWAMEKSKDELDALMRHLIDHTINPIDDY